MQALKTDHSLFNWKRSEQSNGADHCHQKWHQRAASAVSMALTDITAKKQAFRYANYGRKLREQIPVYASFQSYSDRPDWSRHSLRLIERQFGPDLRQSS
ncbi:hypothetical protein PO124_18730 [Bacillus licheniformis]|nr:hypothetical protein [Bacillus licheniformis]